LDTLSLHDALPISNKHSRAEEHGLMDENPFRK
jgi:hypothetical protein